MNRQGNTLKFLHKIPNCERSLEEATEIATDLQSSFMNNTNATSVSVNSRNYCATGRSDRCCIISARRLEYDAIQEIKNMMD